MIALFLYNLALVTFWPLYRILIFLHSKTRQFHESRKSGIKALDEFCSQKKQNEGKRQFPVWLHASSAGEFDQALGLLREIKKRNPAQSVIISIFSLSIPMRILAESELVFYLPLDFFFTWPEIIKKIQPILFATMTWDIFPNLLFHLERFSVPAFLCSAALSGKSYRTRFPMRTLLRSTYRRFQGIGTVNEENRSRFLRLLPDPVRVRVTGDSRYDTIYHKLENSKLPASDERFFKAFPRPLWIMASTYIACDEILFPELPELCAKYPEWKLLVFPHHVDENRILELERGLERFNLIAKRYSELKTGTTDSLKNMSPIIIVDQIGLLALAYRFAEFSYVGGGFHHRVHNVAEGAALGLPIITGPRISSSPVALELEQIKSLVRVKNGKAAAVMIDSWMTDEKARKQLGSAGAIYLNSQLGASRKFYDTFLNQIVQQNHLSNE